MAQLNKLCFCKGCFVLELFAYILSGYLLVGSGNLFLIAKVGLCLLKMLQCLQETDRQTAHVLSVWQVTLVTLRRPRSSEGQVFSAPDRPHSCLESANINSSW